MKKSGTILVPSLLLTTLGWSAAQLGGVTNTASFLHPALPNGGIAQGGMFTLFGIDIGPGTVLVAGQFLLGLNLGGVTVQVTVGGTTVDAIPVVVSSTQVSCILPSAAPIGAGTVILRFNGMVSNALAIRVVANALGIFAINSAGNGPGVFTNALNPASINTILNTARNGEQWDAWATGLNKVFGNEASMPLPGDLGNVEVRVIIGGIEAVVVYRGRSGCCAGLDQIRFIIPDGITGCYVPVVIIVNGVPSNFVTISITPNGGVCSDPAITADDLATAQQQGGLRVGTINLSRMTTSFNSPQGVFESTIDHGSASFNRYGGRELITARSISNYFPSGSCFVITFAGDELEDSADTDPIFVPGIDAGPVVNIGGPLGNKVLQKVQTGIYSSQIGGGLPPFGQPLFLDAGPYTASNSPNGGEVGVFNANSTRETNFVWTNKDIEHVPAGQSLNIDWTGPNTGMVHATGVSIRDTENIGAIFNCFWRASSGQGQVPTYIIDPLPESEITEEGIALGFLSVGWFSEPARFNAPNLDVGLFGQSSRYMKNAKFKGDPPAPGPSGFTVTSTAFTDGGTLPQAFACPGGTAPPLSWQNAPAGTQSFILVVEDPDAPGGTFTHLIAWNIPANITSLPPGYQPGQFGETAGFNDAGTQGYFPACPPSGSHRYIFRVYALPVANIPLPANTPRATLDQFLLGPIPQAQITVTFP